MKTRADATWMSVHARETSRTGWSVQPVAAAHFRWDTMMIHFCANELEIVQLCHKDGCIKATHLHKV
jgi:hypothetical protein